DEFVFDINTIPSYGEISTAGVAQARKKSNVKPAQELIISFDLLKETLNHLDVFSELKGFYHVMVNAPIHSHEEI
ncbi:hypothetical protein BCV72DRAFT_120203, partial [Rhizopus microsporus var. microsporus]